MTVFFHKHSTSVLFVFNTAAHFNAQSHFTQHHDTSSFDLAIFLTVYIYPSRQSFLPPLLGLIISILTEIEESISQQHLKLVIS